MWRRITVLALLAHGFLGTGMLFGQMSSGTLIPDSAARRVGLVRDWYAQIQVDRGQGKLTGITQHVSQSLTYTVYVIDYGAGRELISEHDLDRFGDPLGKANAKRRAEDRVKQLAAQKLSPKLSERNVPVIALFAATDRGTVQALDGMTGHTMWSSLFGSPEYPMMTPGANDRYVAALNGSKLYVINRKDGRLLWERPLGGAPGAGPAVSELSVYVPLVNGMVEVYSIENSHTPKTQYQSHGRAMISPTVASGCVAWPTDLGFVYASGVDAPGLRYRMEARNTIVSAVTVRDPLHLFVSSVDGTVYCLHQRTGDLVWRFSTGEPMTESPAVVDDAVYAVSSIHGLYKIDANTGRQIWATGGINNFLAAGKQRIYCISNTSKLVVLDAATGGMVGSLPAESLDLKFLNTKTDRIYLGSSTGLVQCLREVDLDLPLIYNSTPAGVPLSDKSGGKAGAKKPAKAGKGEAGDTEPAKAPAKKADAKAGDDPFGDGGKAGDKMDAKPAGKAPAKPAADDPFGVNK